ASAADRKFAAAGLLKLISGTDQIFEEVDQIEGIDRKGENYKSLQELQTALGGLKTLPGVGEAISWLTSDEAAKAEQITDEEAQTPKGQARLGTIAALAETTPEAVTEGEAKAVL